MKADKELDGKLIEAYKRAGLNHLEIIDWELNSLWAKLTKELKPLLHQKEREARIDELKRAKRLFSDSNSRGFHRWANGRIKRLKIGLGLQELLDEQLKSKSGDNNG